MRFASTVMVLVLIGGVSAAVAQEQHVGLKAGPVFGVLALEGEDGSDYDRRVAAAGGGFLVLPVSRNVAVQIETLYSPRGAKLYDAESGLTSTLLLDYLDFPVLARIEGPRAFHFFGGPYAAIRVGAHRQIAASGGGFTGGYREDMGTEIERVDWGMVAGGGIHFGRRMLLDARYAWGLRDVNTDRTLGLRFRHRVLTVMAGVRF